MHIVWDGIKWVICLILSSIRAVIYSAVGVVTIGLCGTIVALILAALLMIPLAVLKGQNFVAALNHREIGRYILLGCCAGGATIAFFYGLVSGVQHWAARLDL